MSTSVELQEIAPSTDLRNSMKWSTYFLLKHQSRLYHTLSLWNRLESFKLVLAASKLPGRKAELFFNVALLQRVDRGVPALFRKIDNNWSAVDISICVHLSEWQTSAFWPLLRDRKSELALVIWNSQKTRIFMGWGNLPSNLNFRVERFPY